MEPLRPPNWNPKYEVHGRQLWPQTAPVAKLKFATSIVRNTAKCFMKIYEGQPVLNSNSKVEKLHQMKIYEVTSNR